MQRIETAGLRGLTPVQTSNSQPCQGQVTTVPLRTPSPSGPPRWGQVFSTARMCPPTLKRAMTFPRAATILEAPVGRSDRLASLTLVATGFAQDLKSGGFK